MATALQDSEFPPAAPRNDQIPVRSAWPASDPGRFVLREISMELGSDGLQFFYKTPGPAAPIVGSLDALIAGLLPGSGLPHGLPGPDQTPLDLEVKDAPLLIVFRLDPGLNWHFSSTLPAVTHKRGEESAFYQGLRHVLADGAHSEAPGPGCRLVYFVADPPSGSYQHGFNFNVGLVQRPASGSTEPTSLPLVIDPDIRNPGGSQTS
jgi:hypothetical protein